MEIRQYQGWQYCIDKNADNKFKIIPNKKIEIPNEVYKYYPLNKNSLDSLIETMEQYANYGFHRLKEILKDNPNYFYKNTGFLDMVLDLIEINKKISTDESLEEL